MQELLLGVRESGCLVAVLEDGNLRQVYLEEGGLSTVGNIYKGRVVTVEPSIQAVFVDYGVGRNGASNPATG